MGDLRVILRLAQDNSPTKLPWQYAFGIFRQSFLCRMTLDSSCSSCLHLLSAAGVSKGIPLHPTSVFSLTSWGWGLGGRRRQRKCVKASRSHDVPERPPVFVPEASLALVFGRSCVDA